MKFSDLKIGDLFRLQGGISPYRKMDTVIASGGKINAYCYTDQPSMIQFAFAKDDEDVILLAEAKEPTGLEKIPFEPIGEWYKQMCREMKKRFGDHWLDVLPPGLQKSVLILHQQALLVWMREHYGVPIAQ